VTVCTDSPAVISKGMKKHGLQAIMLSDPNAKLIDQFGIRNQGFHSGIPGGAKVLPIPTTALVDDKGIVRWVDQSENYQRRSDPDYVLGAIRAALGNT
jgi:peroxiredoxin